MKIKINQSLHGYENGHQLLACSMELNTLLKKVLLFQTDLSGSNISKGFETYITGYPIEESNLYAFSRTWYADEMKRPGCVWTHTFLIDFSDLSMIEEFQVLLQLFKRPVVGEYSSYDNEIEVDTRGLFKNELSDDITIRKLLFDSLYKTPKKTVFLPSATPQIFEKTIISLWSDQWPRLRRNFLFCTGALSLKTLNDREFDFQVIPKNIISNIEKQSINPLILDLASSAASNWINILGKYQKTEIRKFLWTFGADIEGKRNNYIPLLELFRSLHSSEFSLAEINSYVNKYFPDSEKGKFLKKNFYGLNSILPVSEKELISYLLSNEAPLSLNYNELQVSDRVINLINKQELSVDEFVNLFEKLNSHGLDASFWKKVELPLDFVLNLMGLDKSLVRTLIERWPNILEDEKVWKLNYSVQQEILHALNHSNVNFKKVFTPIIRSGSDIIFDLSKFFGEIVTIQTLNIINLDKGIVVNKKWSEYIFQNDKATYDWLLENKSNLTRPIFILIFKFMNVKQIEFIKFEAKELLNGYQLVKEGATTNFVNMTACKLLDVGYNNVLKKSYLLVEQLFPYVYSEICSENIGNEIWKYTSRENASRDYDDFFNPLAVISYFLGDKRNTFEIENWNIGRQLLVKTVNRYINNSWPLKSFATTLSGEQEFREAVAYCYTFEKGTKFIKKIIYEIKQGRVKLNPKQDKTIKKLLS